MDIVSAHELIGNDFLLHEKSTFLAISTERVNRF